MLKRYAFGLCVLLLAAPLSAQVDTTAVLSDRQERQRLSFLIAQLENSIEALQAALGHARITYTAKHARIVRDSLRAVVPAPPDTLPDPPPPDTAAPPPPPPPPPPAGPAFYSDFGTCLGVTILCKGDGGKWRIALSSDQHNVGDVVLGSEAGFPSANALRITPNANQSALRLVKDDLGPIPENTSRYYRFHFRLDHRSIGDNTNHPIETNNLLGAISWAFRSNVTSDSTWTAQLRLQGGSVAIFETPTLRQGTPYRVEFQLARLAGQSFNVHARIYDAAGTLLYGDADWRNWSGAGTLASNPVVSLSLEGLTSVSVGLNGISNTDWHPSLLYGYQGAFCIRHDTWCGPYVPGEGR